MSVIYFCLGNIFFKRMSEKKVLFWISSFVSNSNPCIVGSKSCLEFQTELMLNKFITNLFDMFIFLVHTTLKEFENSGFTLKTHQMFPVYNTPEEFKNTITGQFGRVVEEKTRAGNQSIIDIVFDKLLFRDG